MLARCGRASPRSPNYCVGSDFLHVGQAAVLSSKSNYHPAASSRCRTHSPSVSTSNECLHPESSRGWRKCSPLEQMGCQRCQNERWSPEGKRPLGRGRESGGGCFLPAGGCEDELGENIPGFLPHWPRRPLFAMLLVRGSKLAEILAFSLK